LFLNYFNIVFEDCLFELFLFKLVVEDIEDESFWGKFI